MTDCAHTIHTPKPEYIKTRGSRAAVQFVILSSLNVDGINDNDATARGDRFFSFRFLLLLYQTSPERCAWCIPYYKNSPRLRRRRVANDATDNFTRLYIYIYIIYTSLRHHALSPSSITIPAAPEYII